MHWSYCSPALSHWYIDGLVQNCSNSIANALKKLQSCTKPLIFNSLGPNDAIWHWRSWSTLVQVIACCLTAPSHYLNQCRLIMSKILWHSSEDIIIRRFEDNNQHNKIEDYFFKITLRSPRGQWVKGPVTPYGVIHLGHQCHHYFMLMA